MGMGIKNIGLAGLGLGLATKALGDSIGKKDTSKSVTETPEKQADIAFPVLIGALFLIGCLGTVIGLLKCKYNMRADRTGAQGANGNSTNKPGEFGEQGANGKPKYTSTSPTNTNLPPSPPNLLVTHTSPPPPQTLIGDEPLFSNRPEPSRL